MYLEGDTETILQHDWGNDPFVKIVHSFKNVSDDQQYTSTLVLVPANAK